jgi:hypothetical protein
LCSILSLKLIKQNFSFIFIPIEIYIHFVLFFCLGKLIRFNLIYTGSFFQLGRAFKKEYLKSAESTYTSFPLVQIGYLSNPKRKHATQLEDMWSSCNFLFLFFVQLRKKQTKRKKNKFNVQVE